MAHRRLTDNKPGPPAAANVPLPSERIGIHELACALYASQQEWRRSFAGYVSGDPVSDTLLFLYCAQLRPEKITARGVIESVGLPASSGRRWLAFMRQRQWVTGSPQDQDDESLVRLTDSARGNIEAYLRRIGRDHLQPAPDWAEGSS
jgi:hypothetical protein